MPFQVTVTFQQHDLFQVQAGSGTSLYVDKEKEGHAPVGPNPLEVMLSALGSCIGVYAKNYLQGQKIAFKHLRIGIQADLCEDPPIRLANIRAVVDTDALLGDKKERFLKFLHNCPVHNTLLNTKEVDIRLESVS